MNQYAVITGASSGIGYATALELAKQNYNLILAARREDKLEELKEEIKENHPDLDVIVKPVDLENEVEVVGFYEVIKNLPIEIFINNAGIGYYSEVADQDLERVGSMINLNIRALTILSTLFVRDFKDIPNTQLINVSSCGGYTIVPDAISYCASKYFVSSFTEGLSLELEKTGKKLRAKVFAPAATETEFAIKANNQPNFSYEESFKRYHSAEEAVKLLIKLIESNKRVGLVDRETFEYHLLDSVFDNAFNSAYNQKA